MSRIWTVADDINYHLNLDYLRHSSVEEVEGKCSPNETPDFGNERLEGGGGYQAGAGTSSASSTAAAAAAGSSRGAEPGSSKGQPDYRRASSSSHQSQQSDGQSDRQHSDSTSISKTQATSSGSPNESPGRSKSNQRWMKLRTTVQLTGAIQTIQKKAPLKREDSFLKRFSTRQIPEAQDTFEVADDDGTGGAGGERTKITRKKKRSLPRTVVNPDGNFYFYWLMILTFCVLYNLWTLIVRQSFPELQSEARVFWILADSFSDLVFLLDIAVQFRTGYLEQGLMVYKTKKLANHYIGSKPFYFDLCSLLPTDLFQLYFGTNPMFRFPRFLKIYRTYNYYYMVESRTVYPNVWRVVNLIHILLLLAHWFGCFYFLLSEAEHFKGPWVYPDPTNPNNTDFQSLTRKYLGSLYWSTLTLTTIGDLPTPHSNWQYLFTIVSYLIGVFIFATIVGQVGNVITNRNANRLEFERLLDGAKMYMRHHKVPRDMQRRVLRWYDYSWSRGRIQGGGDINTALGLLPDKLKTELALHVNLSVLKKVTIFQECQPEFLHDLVLKMKAYIFTPGDLICRKGEVAREMFIIADGILEVISEQGKVLTTMQAGDFFGEIGILNLDGLNKRTADVRSVGYSELFSLSREDVLAAMKDYPEAQEILQTLGRKRLMEARKASGSANPKKPSSDGKKALAGSSKETPESSGQGTDNTTGKRIVEKLQSDFKGLKDVIRRSRKSNSSRDDSSEPDLDGDGISRDAKSFPPPRGVLKRMHNVLSDEKEKEPSTSTSTSTSSPSVLSKRGVGGKRVQLPLLLKAAAAATSSPQAQVQSPEKEPEVIGEGLPLMQRLRLLKQKEERERKQQEEREAMMKSLVPSQKKPQSPPSNIPCDGDGVAGPSQSGIVRTKVSVEPIPSGGSSVEAKDSPVNVVGGKDGEKRDSISSIESGSFSSPASSSLALAHRTLSPPLKPVSLLIGEAAAIAASRATTEPISISVPPMPPKLTSQIASSPPVLYGSMSPPVQESSVGRDRSASASSAPTCSTSREPVTILRPAALHFRQKTYGSVDDLSPEFSRLPFVKKLKILNERQKIAALLMSKTSSNILTRSTSEGSNDQTTVTGSLPSSEGIEDTAQMHSLLMGRRTQSNQEQLQGSSESGLEELTPTTTSSITIQLVQAALGKYDQSPPEREVKNKGVVISGTNEGGGGCTGLSSVQQQRQHQHEVAKILDDSNATKCLTKLEGQGDADGDGGDGGTLDRNSCKITPSRLSPSPTSGPVSSAKKRKKKKLHTSPTKEKGEEEATSSSSSSSTTTSPPEMDSSETPERRNLKSILKRLAKSEEAAETEAKKAGVVPATVNKKIEERKLLKAPTIEGYAARHRKFAKNVTFHRQAVTVVSPEDLAKAEKSTLHIAEACQDIPYEPISDFRLSSQADMIPVSDDPFSEENLKSFKNMMLVKGEDLPFHPSALQIGLNIAQEECIGSVFIGIKAIIQSKVDEIHARFQDNFNTLEHEVRKRDEIIFRLQRRIHELEKFSDRKRSRNGNGMREEYDPMDYGGHDGDNEMDDLDVDNEDEELLLDPDSSSSEARRYPLEFQTSYLFSRGDSIDTVISAQDYEDEVFERAEALSQAVDQPASFSSEEQGQQQHHQHRRSRDMGNGEWEQKHSSASWAHVAGEERIEMREFGTAPWQVEFHRDRDSLPPPNERTLGTRNIDKDSVAVDIGNSSTDYEGSSSGSEETNNKGGPRHRHHHQQQQPQQPISQKPQQRTKSGVQEVLHRRLKEEPVALDDDEEGDQTDVASDDDDEDDSDDSSGDEPQLTNKNWEVQLLAKEMDKIETRSRPENLEMLGEAKYLQNEIQQMHDAVSSGELSTSELDMLESMLESKSRQVKALVKALSVETQAPPSGGESKPGSSKQIVAKPKTIARSVDDLHGASSSAGSSSSLSRPLATMERLQLAPSQLAPTTSTHFQPRRSLGILPSVPSSLAKPSTSASFREKVSPGERSELHKLFLSRKRSTTVRRQTSLCETSLTHSTTLSETKSERRRESFPVSVPSQEASSSSSAKSFFSKFSLVRQITQRGSSKRSSCIEMEPRSSTATPAVVAMELANETQTQSVHTCSGNTMATITAAAAITTTTSSSASTQDTSSEMVQEQMSSVVNILPGNSGSGPVQAAATATIVTRTSESVVVSIPDVTSSVQPCSSRSLTTSTTSKPGGENQPLLKK